MKQVYKSLISAQLIFFPLSAGFAGSWQKMFENRPMQETPHSTQIEPIAAQLQILEKETHDLKRYENIKDSLEKIITEIATVKDSIARTHGAEKDFLQKKIALLNHSYQVYTDMEQVLQQLHVTFDEQIKLLQEFTADPEFKKLLTEVKAAYTFDDLQSITQRIAELLTRIADLERNKIGTSNDLTKRKKALSALQEDYKIKKKQQAEFGQKTQKDRYAGILIDEQEHLLSRRKSFLELRIKSIASRLELIDTQLRVARSQLAVLKKDQFRIKRATRVNKTYITQVESILETKRQAFVEQRDRLHDKMRVLMQFKDDFKKKFDAAVQQFSIEASDIAALREWTNEPHTQAEWATVSTMTNLIAQDALSDTERDFIEAQIALEKTKFKEAEVATDTVRSWYKITQRSFSMNSDQMITEELKKYDVIKTELQVDLINFTDKRERSINVLHSLNNSLDKVKALSTLIKKQKRFVFRDSDEKYQVELQLLHETEEKIRTRIDLSAQLIEKYSAIIATIGDTIKKTESIIHELNIKGFWRRSVQSIDWSELRNFFPDIRHFIHTVYTIGISYSAQVIASPGKFITSFMRDHPLKILILFINTIIALILFILAHWYIPELYKRLRLIRRYNGALHILTIIGTILVGFIAQHLKSLSLYTAFFTAITFELVTHTYVSIVFYLFSIPYALFIIHDFMRYFVHENQQFGYAIVAKVYQRKFTLIISCLLYLVTAMWFFREAFLLAHFPASQVPTVLLALIYIVCQIAATSLISKEQVLSLIPENTPLWEWVKKHVSKYYYVLWLALITIIVMSNPYVGYGYQVVYVVTRLMITIFVLPLFLWIHDRLKRASSDLFFYSADDEMMKERFSTSRTWYSLFIIISFAAFILTGSYIIAHIWGQPFGAHDVMNLLNHPWYTSFDEFGKTINVSAASLFQIVLFVVSGIFVTYVLNNFVLRRMFDPLLVGSGVQNTILTLTKYVIIFIALFMGLSSAGLDGLTTKFAIVLAGIGWAAHDAVRDFFSYFVILVQRPIKIGDFIEIKDKCRGVVRHITPRSVIVRERNSVTVLVPNSYIVMKPVTNWNYSRNFFAFEDMLLCVPYAVDPALVRSLIFQVLQNHPDILKTPTSIVLLDDFVDNGYRFKIRGFLTADKVLDQWEISSNIRLEIVRILRLNGIEIASPTRIIRMQSDQSSLD